MLGGGSAPSGPVPLSGFALITGASTGLGASFSRRLAAEGRDLILVARDVERLEALAANLRDRYPVVIEVLAADLSTERGCAAVADRIVQDDKPVDTLINNAGFGFYKPFGEVPLVDEQRMLDVNVRAVLTLTHAAFGMMIERGRGEIINLASVAGFLPRRAAATYAAGKAWVISFTENIAQLTDGTGVRVTVICPGVTHTEFHDRAGADMTKLPAVLWLDADRVVAEGLAAARAGKVISIPSKRYRTLVTVLRLLPRSWVAKVVGRR